MLWRAIVIDEHESRLKGAPTYPFVPTQFRAGVSLIAVLVMTVVSLLDPPIWLGALLAGGLMMAIISALQAVLRWRWRRSQTTRHCTHADVLATRTRGEEQQRLLLED
jgi:hypothetical protein